MAVPQKVLDSVYGSKPGDWKQHENGGGWVYKTAIVEKSVYLHPSSLVYGNARVYGDAWVYGNARVYGDAWVYGDAQVFGDARVSGDAWVSGNARVSGNAQVSGNARVSGNDWEVSPLQIQGTKHYLNVAANGVLQIGHIQKPLTWWKKFHARAGKEKGYTPEQIAEYREYVDLAEKWLTRLGRLEVTKK